MKEISVDFSTIFFVELFIGQIILFAEMVYSRELSTSDDSGAILMLFVVVELVVESAFGHPVVLKSIWVQFASALYVI